MFTDFNDQILTSLRRALAYIVGRTGIFTPARTFTREQLARIKREAATLEALARQIICLMALSVALPAPRAPRETISSETPCAPSKSKPKSKPAPKRFAILLRPLPRSSRADPSSPTPPSTAPRKPVPIRLVQARLAARLRALNHALEHASTNALRLARRVQALAKANLITLKRPPSALKRQAHFPLALVPVSVALREAWREALTPTDTS